MKTNIMKRNIKYMMLISSLILMLFHTSVFAADLLADVVQIGDYVDYPVYYENVAYSDSEISTYNGWKVIRIEDDVVYLVSGGTPLTYYYDFVQIMNEDALNELRDNILNISFSTSENATFRKNGFLNFTSLENTFANQFTGTKSDGTTLNVRSIISEDIALHVEPTYEPGSAEDNIRWASLEGYNNLFIIGCNYISAYVYFENMDCDMDIIKADGNVTEVTTASLGGVCEFGIRPVVALKADVKTTGKDDNDVWQLQDTSFITEWRIPVDADEVEGTTTTNASGDEVTLGPQTTIMLPIPTHTSNNYTVDWGDGSAVETFDSTADFPTHTYENTEETTYTIKIAGKVNSFGYYEQAVPGKVGTYKNYFTFTQYLIGLSNWGEMGATRYGFSNCTKLGSTIPTPTEDSFINVDNMDFLFYNCVNLTGSIPKDLFANATKVRSFKNTFRNCTNLNGEIPEELFAMTKEVIYFSSTFYGCSNLSGNIPSNLFAENKNVTDFSYVFMSCTSLNGEIPSNLFMNNVKAKTFYSTFRGCLNLKGDIPKDLFKTTELVNSFAMTFLGCSGLTGSIPEELFSKTLLVTSFESTFSNCSNLTGSIPAKLFEKTERVTTFSNVFGRCPKLMGSIPEELFAKTPEVKTFYNTFLDCEGLTGSIPKDLFNNTPLVTSFRNTFSGCTNLSGEVPIELFAGNTMNTTIPTEWNRDNEDDMFIGTFFNCSNLTSANLNTLYVGFRMFYGCNELTDITIGDNVKAIGTEGFMAIAPYSSTNLLTTNLSTQNSVATDYDWMLDNRFVGDLSTALITEWSVPANMTIKLPIPSNNTNKYFVDWGDGTISGYTNVAAFPTHNYNNTVETIYTIKIEGTVDSFGYYEESEVDNTSEYYTFIEYLIGLKEWGEISATRYGFSNCKNLSGTIPNPGENTFANVTSAENIFNGCSSIGGSIPVDLFSKATEITNVSSAFAGCTNLKNGIPETLFANNKKLENVSGAFEGCIGLSEAIPPNLLVNNTLLTDVSNLFKDCSGLNGNIPESLFNSNTELTTMEGVFSGCIKLTAVPANLFSKNKKVETYKNTFYGCIGLTGMLPAKLFKNSLATNYEGTFENCANITAGEITLNTDIIDNMDRMFAGCTGLENVLLGKEFKNVTGTNMFQNTPNLKAIFMLNNPETTADVGTIANLEILGLSDLAMIYVPYEQDAELYREVVTNISAERISRVVQIVPPNPDYVILNGTYIDPGYTVMGYSMDEPENQKWKQYNLRVEVTGIPVDTSDLGSEWIKYTLIKE